jgi:hypothetical protein
MHGQANLTPFINSLNEHQTFETAWKYRQKVLLIACATSGLFRPLATARETAFCTGATCGGKTVSSKTGSGKACHQEGDHE